MLARKKNIQTRQNLKPATQKIFLIATTGTFENVHKYMLFHLSSAQSNTTILKVKYDHQEKFDSKTSQKIRFVIVKVKSWMGAT